MLINNKKIDRISGPVSFSLLKPKMFIFDELKKEGVRLPIFMLFGDVHFSDKHQCNNCTCVDSSSCCLPIYSDEFLRIIDSIATPENPVDFGIEGFYAGKQKENLKNENTLKYFRTLNKDIMQKLRENNAACYVRELRGTKLYEKYCPTKNIRWQYTDPRHAPGTKYSLEHLIQSLEDPAYKNNLSSLFMGKIPSKSEIKKVINEMSSKDMFYKIIMLKYHMVTSPEKAIDYFFSIATPQNSLVLKQFNKLSKSFKDLPFWKKALSDYFLYALKEGEDKDYGKNPSNDYINLIKKLRKEFYELLIKNDIDTLSIRLTDTLFRNALTTASKGSSITENTIFMDLYYIFRTFKIPGAEGKNPFLSLIYAGDFHRKNITHFLSNIIRYYDIVEEVNIKGDFMYNEDRQMRCTYMPNFNFNELALQYGVDIKNISYVAPHYVEPPPTIRRTSPVIPVRKPTRRTSVRKPTRRTSVRKPTRRTSVRKSARPVRKPTRRTSVRKPTRRTSVRKPTRRTSVRKPARRTSVRKPARPVRRSR